MLDPQEDAVDIDLRHPAKIIQRGFLQGFYQGDAGIVDQHVKFAVGRLDMFYQLAPVLFVGYIETIKFRLPTIAVNTFDHALSSVLLNIGKQHRSTGFTKQARDSGADTAGGTGDDRNFSIDAVDRVTPSPTWRQALLIRSWLNVA
jgi:hypothetical protein